MLTLVLRGFVQRKLRVLLTAVAIALGVALMAGTYILTDTINHAPLRHGRRDRWKGALAGAQ